MYWRFVLQSICFRSIGNQTNSMHHSAAGEMYLLAGLEQRLLAEAYVSNTDQVRGTSTIPSFPRSIHYGYRDLGVREKGGCRSEHIRLVRHSVMTIGFLLSSDIFQRSWFLISDCRPPTPKLLHTRAYKIDSEPCELQRILYNRIRSTQSSHQLQ